MVKTSDYTMQMRMCVSVCVHTQAFNQTEYPSRNKTVGLKENSRKKTGQDIEVYSQQQGPVKLEKGTAQH